MHGACVADRRADQRRRTTGGIAGQEGSMGAQNAPRFSAIPLLPRRTSPHEGASRQAMDRSARVPAPRSIRVMQLGGRRRAAPAMVSSPRSHDLQADHRQFPRDNPPGSPTLLDRPGCWHDTLLGRGEDATDIRTPPTNTRGVAVAQTNPARSATMFSQTEPIVGWR